MSSVLHFVAHPAADSMIDPFSSQFSWQSHSTTGAINSGFNSAKKSKKKMFYYLIIYYMSQ